jgi:hypothetical protein
MTLPFAKTALLVVFIAIYFLSGLSWWCVFAAAIFIATICACWRGARRGS